MNDEEEAGSTNSESVKGHIVEDETNRKKSLCLEAPSVRFAHTHIPI